VKLIDDANASEINTKEPVALMISLDDRIKVVTWKERWKQQPAPRDDLSLGFYH
jgi:hypothetical protein